MRLLYLLPVAILSDLCAADVIPFPYLVGPNGFGGSTTIPANCITALNRTISGCDVHLRNLALDGAYISPNDTAIATSLCSSACESSLSDYQRSVASACGEDVSIISRDIPNTFIGDMLHDYFDLVCATDPDTGAFCADFLSNAYTNAPVVTEWAQLPQDIICSPCQVSYFQTLQKPQLASNAERQEPLPSDILISAVNTPSTACGLSSSLEVLVNQGSFSAVVSSLPSNTTCVSQQYTTKSGDTCKSIALANSVAEGSIWALNNLGPDCTITAGQSLCLPQSCEIYTITPTDTCFTIATNNGVTYSSLLNYNPTISRDCANLHNTSVICISNPHGDFTLPITLPANDSSNANPTTSQYADSIVDPPGAVPFGTTKQCGGYYQVQVADTCQRISLAAGVSIELFELINPSIDENCFNLITDLWYCVHPTVNWNATSTAPTPTSTIPPPTSTPPGTTANCFQWHVIVSGDTCFGLQVTLGVTMADLILWNPDLATDCSNLLLGEAYCVDGSIPATATATGTAPTSTPTGVCIEGEGKDNFGGLCSFACNFGFCPEPCTCTKFGAQVPPPPASETMGYPTAGLPDPDDYVPLCSFTCAHGYCPDGACTAD
ncbi:hypothetical protein F5884DRAFT_876398 [Xylogone sp. PMI_703]|nr:hypothetical protein F5884DRAFT_876398 [Xylogone sp. PMI_703]